MIEWFHRFLELGGSGPPGRDAAVEYQSRGRKAPQGDRRGGRGVAAGPGSQLLV